MPLSMPVSTNGHDPQLDQLPASLEYRLDGEFDLPLMKYRLDGEFDLPPDAAYTVARHNMDTVMMRWPPGVSRNNMMCIVPAAELLPIKGTHLLLVFCWGVSLSVPTLCIVCPQ